MAQAMFRYTFGIVGDAKFGVEGRGLGAGVAVMWRSCDPHGLSGSGVWSSSSASIVWSPEPVLAGLVTEYDEQAQALVAYRIETLVQFLRAKNSELG